MNKCNFALINPKRFEYFVYEKREVKYIRLINRNIIIKYQENDSQACGD